MSRAQKQAKRKNDSKKRNRQALSATEWRPSETVARKHPRGEEFRIKADAKDFPRCKGSWVGRPVKTVPAKPEIQASDPALDGLVLVRDFLFSLPRLHLLQILETLH